MVPVPKNKNLSCIRLNVCWGSSQSMPGSSHSLPAKERLCNGSGLVLQGWWRWGLHVFLLCYVSWKWYLCVHILAKHDTSKPKTWLDLYWVTIIMIPMLQKKHLVFSGLVRLSVWYAFRDGLLSSYWCFHLGIWIGPKWRSSKCVFFLFCFFSFLLTNFT